MTGPANSANTAGRIVANVAEGAIKAPRAVADAAVEGVFYVGNGAAGAAMGAASASSAVADAAIGAANIVVYTAAGAVQGAGDMARYAVTDAAGAVLANVYETRDRCSGCVMKTIEMGSNVMHSVGSVPMRFGNELIHFPQKIIIPVKNTAGEIRAEFKHASHNAVAVMYSSSTFVTQTAQITFSETKKGMAWTSEQVSVTYEKTINGGMYVVKTAGDTCTDAYEVIEDTTKNTVTIIKKKLDPNGKVIETIEELVPLAAGSGTAAAVGFAIAVGLSGPTFGASLGIAVFAALAASSAGYIATKGTSMAINGHRSGEQDLESAKIAAGLGINGGTQGYQYSRNNPPRTARHSV